MMRGILLVSNNSYFILILSLKTILLFVEQFLPYEEIDADNKQITFSGGAPYSLFAGDNLRLRNEQQYPNEEVEVLKVDMEAYSSLPVHAAYCSRCAAKALRYSLVSSSSYFSPSPSRFFALNY